MSTTTEAHEKARSWQMFDRIASTYDLLNQVLSLGIDRRWRRRMGRHLPEGDSLSLLDLATGTGDQLFALCKDHPRIKEALGMDLSEGMMAIAREKHAQGKYSQSISFATGDGAALPLEDNQFDAVTITFGIRNIPDVNAALREMHRVLKPGGRALILEFGTPQNPLFRSAYLGYFRHVLPRIGGMISGDREAYQYLNQTSEEFPCGEDFSALMHRAGFTGVKQTPLSMGIAYLYQGDKK